MGCKTSKSVRKSTQDAESRKRNEQNLEPYNLENAANTNAVPEEAAPPANANGVLVPEGRAMLPNDAALSQSISSTTAPLREPMRTSSTPVADNLGNTDVDEQGNVILLPKGSWIRTEGTPYYYSALENLYYHPPSRQFYDPNNEMWYDSDTNEWYRDDDDEACSNPPRPAAAF